MHYVYDILLNFQDYAYEFYEWNIDDEITHVRKVPMVRISTEQLEKLNNYRCQIAQSFVKKIENKSEEFTNRSVEKIAYLFLATDTKSITACLLNAKGIVVKKSKLLVDEEDEALIMSKNLPFTSFEIHKLRKQKAREFETRYDQNMKKRLKQEIYKLNQQNVEKLKYLYYECFNEKEEDAKKIIQKFYTELNCHYQEISKKLFMGLDLLKVNY